MEENKYENKYGKKCLRGFEILSMRYVLAGMLQKRTMKGDVNEYFLEITKAMNETLNKLE
jgi:hypothetical protein